MNDRGLLVIRPPREQLRIIVTGLLGLNPVGGVAWVENYDELRSHYVGTVYESPFDGNSTNVSHQPKV